MQITDEKGNKWFVDDVQGNSPAFFDKESGSERIVRTFVIFSDPTKKTTKEEVLEHHANDVHSQLFRDGWVAERELEIVETEKGYAIIAVAKAAVKHGSIVGSTNAAPESANKVLNEKNK